MDRLEGTEGRLDGQPTSAPPPHQSAPHRLTSTSTPTLSNVPSASEYSTPPSAPPSQAISSSSPAVFAVSTGLAPNPSRIGAPITFTFGQFAGRTLKVELRELQKATVGRKFLRKDRRPIDPPPSCQLILSYIHDLGTPNERAEPIEDYGDILPEGWLCHVEMLTVAASSTGPRHGQQPTVPSQETQLVSSTSMTGTPIENPEVNNTSSLPIRGGPSRTSSLNNEHHPLGGNVTRNAIDQNPDPEGGDEPEGVDLEEKAQHHVQPGTNVTSELAGLTYAHAVKIDLDNHKALIFVFTDLSSKMEGEFCLRYRCFNVLSQAAGPEVRPVAAECVGGVFRVYSTRAFPGLDASTEFTKSLAIIGIHPNKRETVRKGGQKRKHEEHGG